MAERTIQPTMGKTSRMTIRTTKLFTTCVHVGRYLPCLMKIFTSSMSPEVSKPPPGSEFI